MRGWVRKGERRHLRLGQEGETREEAREGRGAIGPTAAQKHEG